METTRYHVTQFDSDGSFFAHTICDWHNAPPIVRSNGRLFALDRDSLEVMSVNPPVIECSYTEFSEDEIVEL
ncbi:hypothetical protein EVB81_217 [Rhizobium phage RHph_I46]|uniref:Uncharacterized protein n=1 Tax=Rhizobium phage RHph_I1_9 TaxID=2509729 RepID=A0A7S5R9L3_9CAUD|nr:hypothetical protein PP936_gp215 [Rhizobium phage RHph_I1_9]QIG69786.1 hypothetical protein EVB81_217 [Rhizobium phage RHph_I46]QIG71067.1 hypothetical protein EVB92_217 [Rhizobium phage RHph_I9]QIG73652.1 hypothetical protein EVC04_215 [Rhizobium phage RHph_I1_9]QIG76406.1 hypothetical protein EVC25_217 [Rhizobium phage RHph_I34]